jgi:hypothetical protein
VANTLAYYDTATITAVKSFIVQAPVVFFQLNIFSDMSCSYLRYLKKFNINGLGSKLAIFKSFFTLTLPLSYSVSPFTKVVNSGVWQNSKLMK